MKPSNAGVAPSKSVSGEGAVPATADLQAQLALARDQLAATLDILRAIAGSPGDAEGSLRKIAETTARLFNAVGVSFRIVEGDRFGLSVGVGQGAEQISAKSMQTLPNVRSSAVVPCRLAWFATTGRSICPIWTTSILSSRIGLDHPLPAVPAFAPWWAHHCGPKAALSAH